VAARYWPEFAAAGKERIPVRWLLSHQAAEATREQAGGVDRVLMMPTRVGLGFGLPLPEQPWWSPRSPAVIPGR